MKRPFGLFPLKSCVDSSPGSSGNLESESWELNDNHLPGKGDNGSIDLLVGGRPCPHAPRTTHRQALPSIQWLAVSHVPQEKGCTFQTRGLLIFPPTVTRDIQRSSPGRGHVCGTKPCLFLDCSDSLPSCVLCAGNVSSTALYKHPYWLLSPPGLFIDQTQGMRVVGSRRLCHKQVGEGIGGTPRLLFLHTVCTRKAKFRQ